MFLIQDKLEDIMYLKKKNHDISKLLRCHVLNYNVIPQKTQLNIKVTYSAT